MVARARPFMTNHQLELDAAVYLSWRPGKQWAISLFAGAANRVVVCASLKTDYHERAAVATQFGTKFA